MQSALLRQSCNKYRPFLFNAESPFQEITPFHVSQSVPMRALKSLKRILDSVDPTLWRASLTSPTKARYLLTALVSYICNRQNDRSFTLSFNLHARDPKGIQSNTQSFYWGHVRIPTRTWAGSLGSALE